MATALTVALAPVPMTKLRSSDPSGLIRATRLRGVPFTLVKSPTMTNLPRFVPPV
jgi:hypothetical protein